MPFRIGPWEIILILFIFSVYFVPTTVAVVRHAKQKLGIILFNILAGWTLVGWIIAIVWAITADRKTSSLI